MKKSLILACALILGLAFPVAAGVGVATKPSNGPRPARLKDHPLARVVANRDVRIRIAHDRILRSCCKAPDLVVSGTVTNLTPRALEWVKLVIAMKDAQGQIVYAEDTYNQGAVTKFEDPEIAKLLNEKRHADPIAPGASDNFVFTIPMVTLPSYASTLVMATEVESHDEAVAKSH